MLLLFWDLISRVVWVGNKRYSNQILCPDFKLNWSVSNFKLLGIDFSLGLSSMPDLNFRKKIIDVSKILKSWQHRKLLNCCKCIIFNPPSSKSAMSVFRLIFSGFPSHIELKNSLFRSLNSDCFKFDSEDRFFSWSQFYA
jgi:hypothetical protein